MESAQATVFLRRRRWLSSRLALDVVPVAVIVFVGALTIAFSSGGSGQHGSHPYWLVAVLAESALALLVRRRHPLAALEGVLGAYLLSDALPVLLLPMFLALSTVAVMASRRVAAASSAIAALAVVGVPLLHGDPLDPFHVLLPLAAIAGALALGEVIRPGLITSIAPERKAPLDVHAEAVVIRPDEPEFRPSSDSALEADV